MRIDEVVSEDVDMNKVKEFILTKCKDSLKVQPIWRGINTDDKYIHVNTSQSPLRASANTMNYVHLFINGMKAWKSFPRRQVICTSDRMYASGYGRMYRVFPVDGTIIGICPSMDFWQLPYLKAQTKLNVEQLDGEIYVAGKRLLKRQPDNKTVEGFYQDLHEIVELDKDSIVAKLDDLLDPIKNQLRTTPIGSFSAGRQEVWFDGEAMIVAEKETWKLGIKEFR